MVAVQDRRLSKGLQKWPFWSAIIGAPRLRRDFLEEKIRLHKEEEAWWAGPQKFSEELGNLHPFTAQEMVRCFGWWLTADTRQFWAMAMMLIVTLRPKRGILLPLHALWPQQAIAQGKVMEKTFRYAPIICEDDRSTCLTGKSVYTLEIDGNCPSPCWIYGKKLHKLINKGAHLPFEARNDYAKWVQ